MAFHCKKQIKHVNDKYKEDKEVCVNLFVNKCRASTFLMRIALKVSK